MNCLQEIHAAIQDCMSNLTEKTSGNLRVCLTQIQSWTESGNWNYEHDLLKTYKVIASDVISLCNEAHRSENNSVHLYGVIFCLLSCLPNSITESDTESSNKPNAELTTAIEIYCSMDWLKIKLKIALKYARLLLLSRDYGRAVICLEFAEKTGRVIFKHLSAQVADNKFSLANSSTRVETHQDLIVCYLYQAEAFSSKGDYENAKKAFQSAKGMLTDFVSVKDYMVALCFNIGLDLYRLEQYEESVFWLTQSYEAGTSITNSNETRTLLLIAEAYLHWDVKSHYRDALSTLQLADKDNVKWECNLLKLRAYIEGNAHVDDIQCAVHHCCQTIDLSQDKGMQITEILLKSGHKNLAITTMYTLENILSSSLKANKIFEQHLQILFEEDLLSDAEQIVKNYISCYSGTDGAAMILTKVENQGNMLKESNRYVKATAWFDLCIQIATNCYQNQVDESRLVKFYHQKCTCLLELGWYNEAHETLILAEKYAPHHIINEYLKIKLCIVQQDDKEAIELVQSICASMKTLAENDDIAKVLSLCAEFGLKKSKFQVTTDLLEDIVGKTTDSSVMVTALRYLLKLKIRMQFDFTSPEGHQWLLAFSVKICQALESYTDQLHKQAQSTNFIKWILKMLWNLAHINKENPSVIHKLLGACNKILRVCDMSDVATLLQRITCLVSSVTAGLQVVRASSSQDEIAEPISEILESVEEFKNLCTEQHHLLQNTELQNAFKSTRRLLLICEFEAKARIHSHDLENVFEAALSLPDIDAKTYEILAAIAYMNGQHCYSLTVRLLKAAIGKYMQVSLPNYEHVSRLYHSLLCAVLEKMESNRLYENDFRKFFAEVHDLVKASPKDQFPQSELLWFITKSWNVGVKTYLQYGRNSEAINWTQLALDLTNYLVSLKDFYQDQMKTTYCQMLSESLLNPDGTEN